ncbi:MAG: protein kinase [Lysobacterales bacterium]
MRRALEIACAALDEPESRRRCWAEGQCGDDQTLRQEVIALLAADDRPERVLRSTVSEREPELVDVWTGRLVGRYRVGERIASGGMGVVYRAQPESGISQKPVALKVIKRGMDSEEIVRRFLREREILARLDHPHIARLLDGGMTTDDRPWYAMELIEGEALLDYCDRRQLPLAARLGLMLQICEAVIYAHQNLVVHRDLKPGNILVTADGQVKLLDFGIAKLIDVDGESATRSAMAMMTPDYAAPEQYERGPITTQTDVYLLGLVLAELLTGRRLPWPMRPDARDYRAPARLDLAFRARGASTDPELMALATKRSSSVAGLARALSGDLDRITHRATAYEAEQRYDSVAALADDLRRHLHGQPVDAVGPSWTYLAGKFAKRHRTSVLATLAVLGALALGLVTTLREAERLRVSEAQTETTLSMLEDVFLGADPYTARGGDTRATDLLAGVAQRLSSDADLPPAMAARLWTKLGSAYVSLNERVAAERALQAAIESGQKALACRALSCQDKDPTTTAILVAAARSRLAHYRLVVDGRAEALPELNASIDELRAAGLPAVLPLAKALEFLRDYEFAQGNHDAADRISLEVIRLDEQGSGPNSPDTIMALGSRVSVLRAAGQPERAMADAAEALRRTQMPELELPPAVRLYVEQQYAGVLTDLGRSAEAEPVLSAALARANEIHGPASTAAQGLIWELATTHAELGQFELARDEFRELITLSHDIKSGNIVAMHNSLGLALLGNGEADEAVRELAIAAKLACSESKDAVPCVAVGLNQIDADLGANRRNEAGDGLDALRVIALRMGGRAAMRWYWLDARLRLAQGDLAGADQSLQQSRLALPAGATPVDQARWLELEAALKQAQGDTRQALPLWVQAEQVYRSRWTADSPTLRRLRSTIEQIDPTASVSRSAKDQQSALD